MEFIPGSEEKRKDFSPAPSAPDPSLKPQDKGYTTRLENRLRELAGRLHELESYKLLCEKKILELVPGHPLPIKTSHLGKAPPKGGKAVPAQIQAQEIALLQQRIEKLTMENKQLKLAATAKKPGAPAQPAPEEIQAYQNQLDALEREKTSIEESLRGEMLVGEEQRNYIEILKEALEAKIEDLGMKDLLAQIGGGDRAEIFARMALLKKEIDEKRKELVKGEGDIEDMEGLIVDLRKQAEEQKEQLENVHAEYAKAIKDKEEMAKSFDELTQKVHTI